MQRENVSDHLKKGTRYRVHVTTQFEGKFEGVSGDGCAIFRADDGGGKAKPRHVPLEAIRHAPEALDAAKPKRLDAVVPL